MVETAAVMGAVSLGSSILGGVSKAAGAVTNAAGQRLNIQGQMLQTMGQAFGFKAQAQQSKYTANINRYQADVAAMNKEIAEANAQYSLKEGDVKRQEEGLKDHAMLGEMIAQQGASGISVNSGTSAKVRESMVEVGKYNQDVISASAAKKAYGYTVEGVQFGAQADVYRYTAQQNEAQAENAMTAAGISEKSLSLQQSAMNLVDTSEKVNIMGSLVGTAGSVADKWTEGSFKGLTG